MSGTINSDKTKVVKSEKENVTSLLDLEDFHTEFDEGLFEENNNANKNGESFGEKFIRDNK